MGSPKTENGRYPNESHKEINLDHGFWISDSEVTERQWLSVMGESDGNRNVPKTNVSLHDCQKFLQKMNERSTGFVFSLPTEIQWEYACRAGSKTSYWWGNEFDGTKLNCGTKRKNEVGKFPPNNWHLFDMSGNVWEWCENGCLRGGAYDSTARNCRSAKRQFCKDSLRASNIGFRVVAEKLKKQGVK